MNIQVRLRHVKKDQESFYIVLTCEVTQQNPSSNILKSFKGVVTTSGTIGFADDVYIESSLMENHNLIGGDNIAGTAILNYNKKKGTWGWKAIILNQ